ncbi:MAG: hypothetical protein HWD58_15640 [Bacteroidota bacterium]|nr:MAG: hypothetical protein HWD58_15640 [Bacteroidota bacterium]
MRTPIINILGGVLLLLTACSEPRKEMLCKKWRTVALKNAKMEAQIQQTEAMLDTLGQQDPELHQILNVDSLKTQIRQEIARSRQEQQLAMENMFMDFRSNGVVYNTSIDGTDSAYYTLEENDIKIDEARLKGYGETMTMTVLGISSDTLSLRLIDFGDTSFIQLVPVVQ